MNKDGQITEEQEKIQPTRQERKQDIMETKKKETVKRGSIKGYHNIEKNV